MSVISFDEWKQKKAQASALTSRGALREDVSLREAYGFDLCVYIAEETGHAHPDAEQLDQLWKDLRNLMSTLPQEHAFFYFSAFEAFHKDDMERCYEQLNLYLDSEKRIYGPIADCDWWIDSLIWVFTPPPEGMYGHLADLFFRHWPDCAMGWACLALDQSDVEDGNMEASLTLLHMALRADDECYLADYLIASIYYEMGLWKSALPYFERASRSLMYREDAAFYFDFAWACEKAERWEQAAQYYQSVIALDESYPSAINNLGCIYLRQGKYDDALRQFNKAIQLGHDGALPYRNIVSALEKQGKREESTQYIRQHLEQLGPQYELLLEILAEQETFELLREMMPPALSPVPPLGEHKRLIEDWIEARIANETRVFGRNLQMVEDAGGYGRSYYIQDGGCIDLLAYNPKDEEYLLVNVTDDVVDERHLILLWQQVTAFQALPQGKGKKATGVLLCANTSDSIQTRLKQTGLANLEVYEYALEINRKK